MDSNLIIKILNGVCKRVIAEAEYLSRLDSFLNDGDHGANMARGFTKVETLLLNIGTTDIGQIFKKTGETLVREGGGSSGVLFGSCFLKAGGLMADKDDMTVDDFIDCLGVSIDTIMSRSHTAYGEKTMLDAMIPAYDAMKAARAAGKDYDIAFKEGIEAANAGVEFTKTLVARRGLASYSRDRGVGFQDPGATSFTKMLESIAEEVG